MRKWPGAVRRLLAWNRGVAMVLTGLDYLRRGRFSLGELKRQLSGLWETVFGDGPDYTSVFLESSAFRPEDTVLSLDSGGLAAMLFLLPVSLEGMSGRYVYAVATHPEFRGKGHAGVMLELAQRLTEGHGEDFTCLHPASDSLYGFYRRFGFETAFYIREVLWMPQVGADFPRLRIERIPAEGFAALYAKTLPERQGAFLKWGQETLYFLCREAEAQGGGVLSIEGEKGKGFCLFTCPEKGTVAVKETVFSGGITEELLDGLAAYWVRKSVNFRLPGDFAFGNFLGKNTEKTVLHPFGMIKYKKELLNLQGGGPRTRSFMGIALD